MSPSSQGLAASLSAKKRRKLRPASMLNSKSPATLASVHTITIDRPKIGAGPQKLQLIFRLSSDLEGGARLKAMADPAFLTAIAGISLSGLVSAFRIVNWFMRGEPRAIAQAGRWGGVGLFALCFPLLLGLAINQKWTEAVALAAVLLAFFALYGPRLIAPLLPRRRIALDESAGGVSGDHADLREEERVERSIAVLETYLQRKTGAPQRNREARKTSRRALRRRAQCRRQKR